MPHSPGTISISALLFPTLLNLKSLYLGTTDSSSLLSLILNFVKFHFLT